jgi:hypothetical protein
MDRDGRRPRAEGLRHPLHGLRVQAQRPRVGRAFHAEESHQTLVALEAADLGGLESGVLRREQESALAGQRPGIADSPWRPREPRQRPTLQDRVEVEHEVETLASKLDQEATSDPPGLEQAPSRQVLAKHPARKQDHLVDPALARQDAGGGGLDEPRDERTGVGGAQGRNRGKRAHHVAHGSQTNHQNPISLGRSGEWIRAGGDGKPRGGEWRPVG